MGELKLTEYSDNSIVNAYISMKNDLRDNWITNNPILLKGELGVEYNYTDDSPIPITKFKIGDGQTNWNDLPYYGEKEIKEITEKFNKKYNYLAKDNKKMYKSMKASNTKYEAEFNDISNNIDNLATENKEAVEDMLIKYNELAERLSNVETTTKTKISQMKIMDSIILIGIIVNFICEIVLLKIFMGGF